MKTSNRSPAINGELVVFSHPWSVCCPYLFFWFSGPPSCHGTYKLHTLDPPPGPTEDAIINTMTLRCFSVANPKLNLHLASWHPGWGLGDPDPIHTSFSLVFFQKKPDEKRTPGLMNWFFGDFLHSSRHT